MIQKNSFDKWLTRFSKFAQILLVILATFGYFYTVRPIHQKDLLSEKIAEKELELKEQKQRASKITSKLKQALDLYSNSSEELNRIRVKEKEENAIVGKLSKQKDALTQVLTKLTTKIKKLQETQNNLSEKNLLLQKAIFNSVGNLVQTKKEFKKAQILKFTSKVRRSATIGLNTYNLFDFYEIPGRLVSFLKINEEEKIFLSQSSLYDRLQRALNRIDLEHFDSKFEFTDTFIAQLKKASLNLLNRMN